MQLPFNEIQGPFSPDGRWVAYQSNESGRTDVWVAPFPGPGGRWQISTTGGSFARWRRDGNELFCLSPDNKLMAVTVNGQGAAFQAGAVHPLFEVRLRVAGYVGYGPGYAYDVSADGQRFLVNTAVGQTTSAPITLVVNWTAALKK